MEHTFNGMFEGWPNGLIDGRASLFIEFLSFGPTLSRTVFEGVFKVAGGKTVVGLSEEPRLPEGLHRIYGIAFFRGTETKASFFARIPYHFSPLHFFSYGHGNWRPAKPVELDAYSEYLERLPTIGDKSSCADCDYREVIFVCKDALLSTGVRLGPCEIYPLQRHEAWDLAKLLPKVMKFFGWPTIPDDVMRKQFEHAPDRFSPLFAIRFPRVYLEQRYMILNLVPYVRKVFGLLCLHRASYASILGGVYRKVKGDDITLQAFNLNTYYRGNLVLGALANEDPSTWKSEFDQIDSSTTKASLVEKLNQAHREEDMDVAYFRTWAILEHVANATLGNTKLSAIEAILRKAVAPRDAAQIFKSDAFGEKFDFLQLLSLWYAWRNLAAHDGGYKTLVLDPKKRIERNLKRYLQAWQRSGAPIEFGEDRLLQDLQEAARKVVRAFAVDRI